MRTKPVPFLILLPVAAVLLPILGLKDERAAGKAAQAEPRTEPPRRPVALVAGDGLLFVANRDGGTVSVIDTARAAIAREVQLGGRLSDMAGVDGGAVRALLVTDETGGRLVRLDRQGASLRVADQVDVGNSPVAVRVAPDGRSCFVTLLWPRRVAVVSIGPAMRVERTIDLPFAPREQWVSPDGGVLVVADAFGGNLAVIDLPAGRVRAVRSLPGHNIRGIAASADGGDLLFSHLVLDEALETTSSRISWGGIVAGMVRSVALRHLLEKPGDVSGAGRDAGRDAEPAAERAPTPVTRWSVFPTGEQGWDPLESTCRHASLSIL